MKVLVTGGTGNYGKYLVDFLKSCTDWEVHAPSSKELDICKPINLETKFDYIIHGATARHGRPKYIIDVNILGTLNVLEFAEKCGSRLLYISSADVMGTAGNDEPDPSSMYAATKYAGEVLCRKSLVPCAIVRSVNIYPCSGKFTDICKEKLLSGQKIKIYSGSRMYVHYSDVNEAIRMIVEKGETGNFNIPGEVLENVEVARIIADQLNRPLDYELVEGGEAGYSIQGDNLLKLGWTPKVQFRSFRW